VTWKINRKLQTALIRAILNPTKILLLTYWSQLLLIDDPSITHRLLYWARKTHFLLWRLAGMFWNRSKFEAVPQQIEALESRKPWCSCKSANRLWKDVNLSSVLFGKAFRLQPNSIVQVSEYKFTELCPPGREGTPRKVGWWYAARFPKPSPNLWPKSAIFPSLFMTWPNIRYPI